MSNESAPRTAAKDPDCLDDLNANSAPRVFLVDPVSQPDFTLNRPNRKFEGFQRIRPDESSCHFPAQHSLCAPKTAPGLVFRTRGGLSRLKSPPIAHEKPILVASVRWRQCCQHIVVREPCGNPHKPKNLVDGLISDPPGNVPPGAIEQSPAIPRAPSLECRELLSQSAS